MLGYKKQNQKISTPFNGINIVPFTDIILVLLIIFMISAPGLKQSGLDIQLPKSSNKDINENESLKIDMNKEGIIFLKQKRITMEQLDKDLKQKKTKENSIEVLVNADEGVEHGKVVRLLDVLRNNQISKIYIGTETNSQ